jgi:FkbM family methyltransferase
MSMTDLLNPVFSLGARLCERSALAAGVIRNLHFRGKGRIIQRISAVPMSGEVTATCGGIRYHLDLRDDVQRELYFNVYERADLLSALELIPSGAVCLDVGANSGAYALPFAKKVGAGGLIHAFEADARVCSRLQSNCKLNGFEKILKCHAMAVSNVTGPLSFYKSNSDHSGWGSLVEFPDIAARKESVQAVTLDDFLAGEELRHVDFLKVDIEAHEPELLAGAKASLLRHVFRFILIEFNGIRLSERGRSLDDVLKPLETVGYKPIKLRLELLREMRAGRIRPESVCANFLFAAED